MERFGTVAIVGVGLIGGSIGLTLRDRALADRIIGVGRSRANLDDALRVRAIDEATTHLREGVTAADVVVVCTPVTQIVETVKVAASVGRENVLVVDAGSTKRRIVEEVQRDPRACAVFVGGHPIAGSERKGAQAAILDLFDRRVCVVTPTEQTPADRLSRSLSFWKAIGCRVLTMDPADHDRSLAYTSHLPHAVSAALAATVPVEALGLAAGAYRDGTRVSLSDGKLWSGIFRANREPLLQAIAAFEEELSQLKQLVQADDDESLVDWWNSARSRRAFLESEIEGPGNEKH